MRPISPHNSTPKPFVLFDGWRSGPVAIVTSSMISEGRGGRFGRSGHGLAGLNTFLRRCVLAAATCQPAEEEEEKANLIPKVVRTVEIR